MINDITKLFLNLAPYKIYLAIRKNCKTMYLFKESKIVYSHVETRLFLFEDNGLIESKKVGRDKIISFTEKGKKVYIELNKLLGLLKNG